MQLTHSDGFIGVRSFQDGMDEDRVTIDVSGPRGGRRFTARVTMGDLPALLEALRTSTPARIVPAYKNFPVLMVFSLGDTVHLMAKQPGANSDWWGVELDAEQREGLCHALDPQDPDSAVADLIG